MDEMKFPSEQVELPSKGLLYPKENPLSKGKVEMKYMTAKEEDILTNQSFISKGVVLDKLLEALIVNKDIKLDDLLVGDKNAILISSRILGYGKDYDIVYAGETHTVDLIIKKLIKIYLKMGIILNFSSLTLKLLSHFNY